jgi:hypothetical protein
LLLSVTGRASGAVFGLIGAVTGRITGHGYGMGSASNVEPIGLSPTAFE